MPKIHNLDPTGPEECQWLFAILFMDPYFAIRMRIPNYYLWLINQNHERAYAEYHDMLRLLGRHFSYQYWVLKAPRHLIFLDALLKEFPDACIVWPHRDLTKVIPSLCSMGHCMKQGLCDNLELARIGEDVRHFIREMLERAMAVRDTASARRFYDLQYNDLVANPAAEVRKIYDYFGLPFPVGLEQRVKSWLGSNPEHKYGRHNYSMEQFGLHGGKIRKEFAHYTERFSVVNEE